jgi:hypothetical protein
MYLTLLYFFLLFITYCWRYTRILPSAQTAQDRRRSRPSATAPLCVRQRYFLCLHSPSRLHHHHLPYLLLCCLPPFCCAVEDCHGKRPSYCYSSCTISSSSHRSEWPSHPMPFPPSLVGQRLFAPSAEAATDDKPPSVHPVPADASSSCDGVPHTSLAAQTAASVEGPSHQ